MEGTDLNTDKLSYEEAYQQLERIVEKLENEQVSLQESLQLFELGQALSQHCAELLENAEQRLRSLQPDSTTATRDEEN